MLAAVASLLVGAVGGYWFLVWSLLKSGYRFQRVPCVVCNKPVPPTHGDLTLAHPSAHISFCSWECSRTHAHSMAQMLTTARKHDAYCEQPQLHSSLALFGVEAACFFESLDLPQLNRILPELHHQQQLALLALMKHLASAPE